MRGKMKAVLLCVICAMVLALPVSAKEADADMEQYAADVQALTNTINGLSGASSEKDVAAASAQLQKLGLFILLAENQGNGLTGSMVGSAPTSLQEEFAKRQLQLASQMKDGMAEYLNKIERLQQEQSLVSQKLNEANTQKETVKPGTAGITASLRTFMDERDLPYSHSSVYGEAEWDSVINVLTVYQNQLTVQIQQQMVFLQDYMGQYNSSVQGAYSAMQGMQSSLGQTMFGGGSGGLLVTAALGGVCAGVLLTLFAGKMKNRKNP